VSVDSSVPKLNPSCDDPSDALEYLPPEYLLHRRPATATTRRAGGAPPLAPVDVTTVCTAVNIALAIASSRASGCALAGRGGARVVCTGHPPLGAGAGVAAPQPLLPLLPRIVVVVLAGGGAQVLGTLNITTKIAGAAVALLEPLFADLMGEPPLILARSGARFGGALHLASIPADTGVAIFCPLVAHLVGESPVVLA